MNTQEIKQLLEKTGDKIEEIIQDKEILRMDKIQLLSSLPIERLTKFFLENKEICYESNFRPYEVTKGLDVEKQKDFVSRLESMKLTLNEKREILATLHADAKKSIKAKELPKEYEAAISIETMEYGGKIILDLERNLENYRGLDKLITIKNPHLFKEEQKAKFVQLCDICPNLQIMVYVLNNKAIEETLTASEYKKAEDWISSVINNLNSGYSKVQKMTIIDNAIGKKVSYTPDYDTEVYEGIDIDSRIIWKIVNSGYGVCNGIAWLEHYMLARAGIESEMISSGSHVFLKIKNIEIPFANGEIITGNTIVDPTWNLSAHRFGAMPDNFCISYEKARKNDIDEEGKDHECHKKDEELQDATLNLDKQSLRNLFASVGLADERGRFPIEETIEKSKILDEFYAKQPKQNIQKQFLLLSQVCPEFASCQNSSMSMISEVLLNNENLKFDKCVVNRVYNRLDKEKEPILFVCIELNELGKQFYYADKNVGQMVELSQEQFEKQFECYDKDLKKMKRS